MFFLKKLHVAPINLWLLQEQKPLIHNILDGCDIKAFNQNLYDKNEWDFYFRNHTGAFYWLTLLSKAT